MRENVRAARSGGSARCRTDPGTSAAATIPGGRDDCRLVDSRIRVQSHRTGQRRAASSPRTTRRGLRRPKAEFLEEIQRPVMTVRRRGVNPPRHKREWSKPVRSGFCDRYWSSSQAERSVLRRPAVPVRRQCAAGSISRSRCGHEQIRSPAATPDLRRQAARHPKVRPMSAVEQRERHVAASRAMPCAKLSRAKVPLSRQAARAVVMVQFVEPAAVT